MNTNEESKRSGLSRREALKILASATGAVTLSNLPFKWRKPSIEVGVLPAHAQASGPSPTPTPISGQPPLGNEFAVMGTASDGNLILVFPKANTDLPNPTQNIVPGLPTNALPHGVAYFGNTGGLVADGGKSRIFVVDLATSTLIDTLSTSDYNGFGTIAVAPGSGFALACGSNTVNVIQAPFNSSSNITTITLPGGIRSWETQAIVFNAVGRAFVYHTQGISVLDPPYDAITFTISVSYDNNGGGAIAISPNGNTLLTTDWLTSNIYIFKVPFNSSSTPETLTITTGLAKLNILDTESITPAGAKDTSDKQFQAVGFAGINITADGTKALVCSNSGSTPKVYAISAPFSSSSAVEEMPLPSSLTFGPGFEDIGLSPDGKLAIVTGGSGAGAPAAFIQAPFTAAEAQVFAVDIMGGGRGAGAVRFQPANT